MSIQFGGISSGLPVNDIVNALLKIDQRPLNTLVRQKATVSTQQTQFSAIANKFSKLKNSLSTLTSANLGTSFDLFSAKTATSSDTTSVTATVTNQANPGSLSLDVQALAIATKATSLNPIGKVATGNDSILSIAQGTVKAGEFSIFVNNQAAKITVNNSDSIQNVLDRVSQSIASISGQAASGSVNSDGQIEFTVADGTRLKFGAGTDTSNFATLTKLTTGSQTNTDFTGAGQLTTLNLNGTLVGNGANLRANAIQAGTLTIGQANITVTNTTTLKGFIEAVNSNAASGVQLAFDPNTNKLTATSKTTGNLAIFFDDNGTNVLQSLGLVNGNDSLSSQTLGQNARVSINGGTTLQSASNNLGEDITGLSGVTLNLNKVSNGTTITIAQNTSRLSEALQTVANDLNDLIATIDLQTAKGGALAGESGLVNLRNTLFSQFTSAASSNLNLTSVKTLASIGFSTGAASPGSTQVSKTFSLNTPQLNQALTTNPDEVKTLLIGNGSQKGLLYTALDTLTNALNPEFGLFSSRSASANAQIKSLDQAIARQQTLLDAKEKRYRNEFKQLEKLMTQFQSQQSAISTLNFSGFSSVMTIRNSA